MTTDNNLNNRIKEWIRKAEEDLVSAEVLLQAKKITSSNSGNFWLEGLSSA